MSWDQYRIEDDFGVAGPIDPKQAIRSQHPLAALPVAMIIRLLGPLSTGDLPEVVGLLRPQTALTQGAYLNALDAEFAASALTDPLTIWSITSARTKYRLLSFPSCVTYILQTLTLCRSHRIWDTAHF